MPHALGVLHVERQRGTSHDPHNVCGSPGTSRCARLICPRGLTKPSPKPSFGAIGLRK
jgi:hypothetical protein